MSCAPGPGAFSRRSDGRCAELDLKAELPGSLPGFLELELDVPNVDAGMYDPGPGVPISPKYSTRISRFVFARKPGGPLFVSLFLLPGEADVPVAVPVSAAPDITARPVRRAWSALLKRLWRLAGSCGRAGTVRSNPNFDEPRFFGACI